MIWYHDTLVAFKIYNADNFWHIVLLILWIFIYTKFCFLWKFWSNIYSNMRMTWSRTTDKTREYFQYLEEKNLETILQKVKSLIFNNSTMLHSSYFWSHRNILLPFSFDRIGWTSSHGYIEIKKVFSQLDMQRYNQKMIYFIWIDFSNKTYIRF